MQRALPRLWLASVLALALAAPAARATSVIAPDFDSLVAQADYVVRAKVKAVTSAWRESADQPGQRYIASRIELEVLETITGTPPAPLVLNQVGGSVGDEHMEIVGAPKFQVGDEHILFVRGNGRLITPFVALMHGYYPVRRDARTGEDQVLRSSGKFLYSEVDVVLPLAATSGTLLTNPQARPLSAAAFAAKIRHSAATSAASRAKLH